MSGVYSIGVDLGGTNLRIASYTQGTEFLDTIVTPTRLSEGKDAVVRDICDAIRSLQTKRYGLRLAGIGVGSPGPLELPRGILHNPPNLIGWDGFDLRHAIESELGCEIFLENDANLAALAEQRLGSGRTYGVHDLCVLTLGTGVGSGIILNGNIWHGFSGMGGEAGHAIMVDAAGPRCPCGASGCLELYASATGILRMARETMAERAPRTCAELAAQAEQKDTQALMIFDKVGSSLGIALAGLVNLLNLPLYVIAGGVCDAWHLFATPMFEELNTRSFVYRAAASKTLDIANNILAGQPPQETCIARAQLGATAGLLGACILPLLEAQLPEQRLNGTTANLHFETVAGSTTASIPVIA